MEAAAQEQHQAERSRQQPAQQQVQQECRVERAAAQFGRFVSKPLNSAPQELTFVVRALALEFFLPKFTITFTVLRTDRGHLATPRKGALVGADAAVRTISTDSIWILS